jgi:CMP/dCMP kinase
MKISLAGTPGSGKSTIRKMLANRYKLEVKATGDFMREAAKRHGYSDITKFLVEFVSSHPQVDREVDEEQRQFGATHSNFVLDAHLGFYFVQDSFKICLTCSFEEAGRRIFDAKRQTEDATTIEEAVETSRQRRSTMRKNFMGLYQVDIDDLNQFNLVLDTTKLSPGDVFEKLTQVIDPIFFKNNPH